MELGRAGRLSRRKCRNFSKDNVAAFSESSITSRAGRIDATRPSACHIDRLPFAQAEKQEVRPKTVTPFL